MVAKQGCFSIAAVFYSISAHHTPVNSQQTSWHALYTHKRANSIVKAAMYPACLALDRHIIKMLMIIWNFLGTVKVCALRCQTHIHAGCAFSVQCSHKHHIDSYRCRFVGIPSHFSSNWDMPGFGSLADYLLPLLSLLLPPPPRPRHLLWLVFNAHSSSSYHARVLICISCYFTSLHS